MDTYSYTRLGEKDIDVLHQLRQVFAVAFNDDATWNEHVPSDSYLAKVLADSNCITLVATKKNGQVVGGLVAYVLPKFEQERSEIYCMTWLCLASTGGGGLLLGLLLN